VNRTQGRLLAAAVAALCAGATAPSGALNGAPEHAAALRHDPRFVLEAVARRMGIRLRPEVPLPAIRLESRTPLARLQAAAEREWGFRPRAFVSVYAPAGNAIYLIDDATHYRRHGGTPDDSLAHEFVHYLQAVYRRDALDADWVESEAVSVQTWFRSEYMAPTRLAALPAPRARPETGR